MPSPDTAVTWYPPVHRRADLRTWLESAWVQRVVIVVIILNAAIQGLDTSNYLRANYGHILTGIDQACLVFFVIELVLKMYAQGRTFIRNGWNIFDFIIIAIALIPGSGSLSVLRALRVLRIFRLISVMPQLRFVVEALATAVPGMISIGALLSVVFYVAGVMAASLFGAAFPEWFGGLGRSLYTLFQIMTLESWSMGIVRPVMERFPYAWAFFVPFILISSFAVLNLFIAVIVDSMQTIHDAQDAAAAEEAAAAEAAAQAEAGADGAGRAEASQDAAHGADGENRAEAGQDTVSGVGASPGDDGPDADGVSGPDGASDTGASTSDSDGADDVTLAQLHAEIQELKALLVASRGDK